MPPPNARRVPIYMSRENDRESDDPPPLTSRDGNSVDRDSYAVGKARAAMASASEASKNASEALTVSKSIALKIGSSPDPSLGVPGHGLFGVVAGIVSDVHGLGVKLDGLAATLAADRAAAALAAESRKGSVAKVAAMIAGPTLSIAVAAFLGWLAGFHR